MKFIFCLLFCCSLNAVLAQANWHSVDQRARHIPASHASSTSELAGYIQSNFSTDTEKLRAIYTWVTQHINYDKDSILHFNKESEPALKVTEAMRRRKGVCENFAAIFQDVALKCNIAAVVIPGYTKQGSNIDKASHSWCAAKVDGKWFLFDPTWDEDFEKETHYFKVEPRWFINTHMPFDPLWQLLPQIISHDEFKRGSWNKRLELPGAYDSLDSYLKLNPLEQYEATARRMRSAGQMNELAEHHYRFVLMQIGIIRENENMMLYNAAVAKFNNANRIFNDFIQYRNNAFSPSKPDEDLANFLTPANMFVNAAMQDIDQIKELYPDHQYNPAVIRNRLLNLQRRLDEQQQFVQKFITTPPQHRISLFYK